MGTTTNTLRDVKTADLLANQRETTTDLQTAQPGSQTAALPQYIIGPKGLLDDKATITDELVVAPDADSGTFQKVADSVTVPDKTVIGGGYDRTKYTVWGGGFWTGLGDPNHFKGHRLFVSTGVGGFIPKQPIIAGFSEVGS